MNLTKIVRQVRKASEAAMNARCFSPYDAILIATLSQPEHAVYVANKMGLEYSPIVVAHFSLGEFARRQVANAMENDVFCGDNACCLLIGDDEMNRWHNWGDTPDSYFDSEQVRCEVQSRYATVS